MNIYPRNDNRIKRARRVREKVNGSLNRPRLAIFRSLNHIYVQLIDDDTSQTLLQANDRGLKGTPIERSVLVGQKIAELAKEKKIKTIVFDRAGNKYHGRVSALAEAARTAGLEF